MDPIGLILIICALFVVVYFLVFRNRSTSIGLGGSSNNKYTTLDDRYNAEKKAREDELNRLLEKIHKKGIDSLSKSEKTRLDELTKK